MTREEADFIGGMNMCDEISNEAYKKIMCHCEEQEPCEDCISRQAVIIALGEWIVSGEYQYTNATDYLVKRIKALPPVKLKSKIGHWIAVENEEMETMGYYCSECDLPMETENQTRFCPNCGAKMDEPQESEVEE